MSRAAVWPFYPQTLETGPELLGARLTECLWSLSSAEHFYWNLKTFLSGIVDFEVAEPEPLVHSPPAPRGIGGASGSRLPNVTQPQGLELGPRLPVCIPYCSLPRGFTQRHQAP